MSLTWNRAFSKSFDMVSGAYLRRQGETLIAMSRATIDLGIAGRLREMACDLQTRAAEQADDADAEMTSFPPPVRR